MPASQTTQLISELCAVLKSTLENYQTRRKALKFNLKLEIVFEKANDITTFREPPVFIYTKQHELYTSSDISDVLQELTQELTDNIQRFELTGSGFIPYSL